MIAFYINEDFEENTWSVGLTKELYDLITPYYLCGSYNIIPARILGFSFPDYLRYVRDNFNATLRGREGYSVAFYKNKEDCKNIVNLLNKEWWKIEKELVEKLNSGREQALKEREEKRKKKSIGFYIRRILK